MDTYLQRKNRHSSTRAVAFVVGNLVLLYVITPSGAKHGWLRYHPLSILGDKYRKIKIEEAFSIVPKRDCLRMLFETQFEIFD